MVILDCIYYSINAFLKRYLTTGNHDWQQYEDENGDLKEGSLDGMMSRIFQHEYDHILGRNFTEYASKMKLDRAYKRAEKQMDKAVKRRASAGVDN